jgi:hypothetical protein
MIGSMILAMAMTGQPPAGPGQVAAKAKAVAKASPGRDEGKAKLIAKRKAKKSAAYAGRLDREAREAEEEAAAIKEAKAEFERTLPARLENQRQLLQRQTDMERNMVLNRMAGAMERSAGYVYPGQSPTQGPFPR